MFDQRHLRAFIAVAETGSVSRAATHLGYSQPAVTQQIRHMEAELGVPLFDRDSLPLRLTPEGRERLIVAEAIVMLGQRLSKSTRHVPHSDHE
ncbi:MAG TPA: LysR family transcriptional regulator [Humibacillus xanthopallidus]|nr:LysR family transcriptional regulator [Humibacillus xanthopallidus]